MIYNCISFVPNDPLFLLDQQAWKIPTNKMVYRFLEPALEAEDSEVSMSLPREVNQLVITRQPKMCNFLDYKEYKIVYKRFASLYFITIVDKDQNELIVLELMQSFVEILDKYFGNVC